MNAQHTPGPWSLGTKDCGGYPLMSETEGHFCDICDVCEGNESQANARLIAAAPELLAACKRLMDTVALNLDDTDPQDVEACQMAQDAIAKATGE